MTGPRAFDFGIRAAIRLYGSDWRIYLRGCRAPYDTAPGGYHFSRYAVERVRAMLALAAARHPHPTFIHNATLDGTQDEWRVAGQPEVYATEADAVAAYRAARRASATEV